VAVLGHGVRARKQGAGEPGRCERKEAHFLIGGPNSRTASSLPLPGATCARPPPPSAQQSAPPSALPSSAAPSAPPAVPHPKPPPNTKRSPRSYLQPNTRNFDRRIRRSIDEPASRHARERFPRAIAAKRNVAPRRPTSLRSDRSTAASSGKLVKKIRNEAERNVAIGMVEAMTKAGCGGGHDEAEKSCGASDRSRRAICGRRGRQAPSVALRSLSARRYFAWAKCPRSNLTPARKLLRFGLQIGSQECVAS